MLAVEARLRDPHLPRRGGLLDGEAGLEARSQRRDVAGAKQREGATPLGGREPLHLRDEVDQLGGDERRGVERACMTSGVLEVALHAHRAEEKQPDVG